MPTWILPKQYNFLRYPVIFYVYFAINMFLKKYVCQLIFQYLSGLILIISTHPLTKGS
ncbi:putative membrane protein [Escherichia coli DEC12B]|nr:putative membrane protein [Escherichia coli DEC12B]